MTFALLLAEDPANRHAKNIFDTLAARIPTVPDSSVPLFMFSEMLFYANYRRQATSGNKLHLLGKTQFGPRRK